MKLTAQFMGKVTEVTLSNRAKSELEKRSDPVYLEMELYFSCLVRKRVYECSYLKNSSFSTSINDTLVLSFKPVMTDVCMIIPEGEEPPPQVSTYPVVNPERFVPSWLSIDYKNNKWCGDFGYRKDTKLI